MMLFFGKKWRAPAFEDAVEVCPMPGQDCLLCEEPILPDESGVMLPYIANMGRGAVFVPEHIECFMRSVLGSVEHITGQCSCEGPGHDSYEPEGTYREQAQATMKLLTSTGGF